MKKKAIIGLFVICICVLLVSVMIPTFQRNKAINEIKMKIHEVRTDEAADDTFYIYVKDKVANNEKFQKFLAEQVKEMYQNKEYYLMRRFLLGLESADVYSDIVVDTLNNCINSSDNIDEAMLQTYQLYGYYQEALGLNKNTGIIAKYINANGAYTASQTKGEGYYASYTSKTSSERIGITGSNLHRSQNVTYFGDFEKTTQYGVTLDKYYSETAYSYTTYAFRDAYIDFDPTIGECIWSGEYLFCFDSNGDLLDFDRVVVQAD